MYQNLYNILTEFLGESKQGSYIKDTFQYQFNCPRCAEENCGVPDNKFNLEINLQKLKFNCWKCSSHDEHMSGNLSNLVKKYGGISIYRRYKEEIDTLKKARLFDINLFAENPSDKCVETLLELPKTFRKIDLLTCRNDNIVKYLESRKITQDIINKFNIGYTTWNEEDYYWRNRIIVPSYDAFGDLNYYAGRIFKEGDKRSKYKNCDENKKEIIFNESQINWDNGIYLVEGVFDSIYSPNTIALLGKVLTRDSYLYQSIVKNSPPKVVICLDADTNIDETKRIYSLLNNGKLRNKIYYIRLDKYKDFGEVYENQEKKGIINTLKKEQQFEEIDLVF